MRHLTEWRQRTRRPHHGWVHRQSPSLLGFDSPVFVARTEPSVTVAGVGHPRTLPHRVVAAGVFALCGPHGVSKTLTGQVRAPICSVRLTVRTPGFHPGNRGSIPLRSTIGVSFNGRTLVFGTSHGGSTPSTPTISLVSLPLPVFFSFLFGWQGSGISACHRRVEQQADEEEDPNEPERHGNEPTPGVLIGGKAQQ